jgi:SAM-dependent methyltransferase
VLTEIAKGAEMRELSKSIVRRQRDPNFITKYFVGNGLDIGGLPDPFSLYSEFFPLSRTVRIWDWEDGDAQFLESLESNSFDFIVSSHCLEHLQDPIQGLGNWIRVTKPGGHLVITVPDEDMYEQGVFPSNKNLDHKTSFTVMKKKSWSTSSINLVQVLTDFSELIDVRKIEVLDSTYRFDFPNYDQTATPIGESAIELILRKRTAREIENGTNQVSSGKQPIAVLRRYFNQYIMDYKNLKLSNNGEQPFKNETEL